MARFRSLVWFVNAQVQVVGNNQSWLPKTARYDQFGSGCGVEGGATTRQQTDESVKGFWLFDAIKPREGYVVVGVNDAVASDNRGKQRLCPSLSDRLCPGDGADGRGNATRGIDQVGAELAVRGRKYDEPTNCPDFFGSCLTCTAWGKGGQDPSIGLGSFFFSLLKIPSLPVQGCHSNPVSHSLKPLTPITETIWFEVDKSDCTPFNNQYFGTTQNSKTNRMRH